MISRLPLLLAVGLTLALSACEHAMTQMNNTDQWRANLIGVTVQRTLGAGSFTWRVIDEQTMLDDVITADKLGFDIATHAIADKAHWLMLNWYERAIELNGVRDRRFRLVHALYPAMPEIKRAGNIGARPEDAIGIQTLRGGDIAGEHTVMFVGQGERLELVHRASTRDHFARGAIRAAEWLAGRDPGLYPIERVFGLETD